MLPLADLELPARADLESTAPVNQRKQRMAVPLQLITSKFMGGLPNTYCRSMVPARTL